MSGPLYHMNRQPVLFLMSPSQVSDKSARTDSEFELHFRQSLLNFEVRDDDEDDGCHGCRCVTPARR